MTAAGRQGTVGLVGLLHPVTGVLLGIAVAGEVLTAQQVCGLVLVLAGVVLGRPTRGRRTRTARAGRRTRTGGRIRAGGRDGGRSPLRRDLDGPGGAGHPAGCGPPR